MDHVVYLDAKANEFDLLLSGRKSMIIRGAAGRKMPYGRVFKGDNLYFINNNAEGQIKGRAVVSEVFESEKMTPQESEQLIYRHQEQLQLTDKQRQRWAGKRYIVLISVEKTTEVKSFAIDRSQYGNMDDWLPVEDINKVRI